MPDSTERPIAGADRLSLDTSGWTNPAGVRTIFWFAPGLAIAAGLAGVLVNLGGPSAATLVTLGAFVILAVDLSVRWRVTKRLLDALTVASDEIEAKDRALAELDRTAEVLSAIVRSSPVAVHAVGRDRNVTIWNPASERVFGWPADEIIGGPLPVSMLPPDEPTSSLARIERTIAGAGPDGERVRRLSKDGKARWIDVHSAPLRDRHGRAIGAVDHLVDMTELVQVEAQLLQAQKMASIGLLASGLAHDFNNTLAVAGGFAKLISEEAADPRIRDDAEAIVGVVERARQLSRQLLAFTRETEPADLMTDVPAVVSDLVPLLRQLLGPEIETRVEVPEGRMIVRTEACLLEQALINLAVNARDAMPGGGRLSIAVIARSGPANASPSVASGPNAIAADDGVATMPAAGEDDPFVEITVRDSGCGIPAERIDRIFEPFFTTKGVGHGSGLGLAMVRKFAAGARGGVTVESAPGVGTTVAIRLPLARQQHGPRGDSPAAIARPRGGPASYASVSAGLRRAGDVFVARGDRGEHPGRETRMVGVA